MNVLAKFRGRKAVKSAGRVAGRYGLLSALVAFVTGTAFAGGAGGAEFTTMLTTVVGWVQGDLGKLLAVSAFVIGMGIGIVKQSIMAIALGIGFALALAYGPDVIQNIFTFAI